MINSVPTTLHDLIDVSVLEPAFAIVRRLRNYTESLHLTTHVAGLGVDEKGNRLAWCSDPYYNKLKESLSEWTDSIQVEPGPSGSTGIYSLICPAMRFGVILNRVNDIAVVAIDSYYLTKPNPTNMLHHVLCEDWRGTMTFIQAPESIAAVRAALLKLEAPGTKKLNYDF